MAVPVIRWLGKRLMNPACILSQNPIPMKSDNDMEYHDFSKGIIQLNSTEWLNCSSKPEKCIFGDMSEVVSDVFKKFVVPTIKSALYPKKKERGD